MKNHRKIIIIIFLLLLFAAIGFTYAQPLEVDYPEIRGFKPKTIQMPLADYAKYIFNFVISIVGIIALTILVISGTRYLSSTGRPEELAKARNQILSAFSGIIILLASLLILYSINPEIIGFDFAKLEKHDIVAIPSLSSYTPPGGTLKRIKDLAEAIRPMPEQIREMADRIKQLTDGCECSNTRSLVLCSGGGSGSSTIAHQCYAGPGPGMDFNPCGEANPQGNHPCPDIETIKEFQKAIVDWKDVILYYRNRSLTEIQDLNKDITEIVNEKIAYYRAFLNEEKRKGTPNKLIISFLEGKLKEINKEKRDKQDLIEKLADLSSYISEIENPITKIAPLPDKCFFNVADKCKPSPKIGTNYGCHDKICGGQPNQCEPVDKDNPNPCPTKEIQAQIEEINNIKPMITQICDKIIHIIDNMK